MRLAFTDVRMRDPFVLEVPSGGYVLFGTTDTNLWGGPATGFDCFTSADLVTWEGPVEAFRPPPGFWADTQFWAPEVHVHDGRFVMFATFASSDPAAGPRGIQVLVAMDRRVPTSPGARARSRRATCRASTGRSSSTSTTTARRGSTTAGVPRECPAASRVPPTARCTRVRSPRTCDRPPATPSWCSPRPPRRGADRSGSPRVEPPEQLNLAKDPLFTEGPFLSRTDTGSLLMLWSSFGEEGYAMGVARSASGSVHGPWVQQDEPLWARNGGHGMVFTDREGVTQLVFHWPNETPDERVKVVAVEITDS